MKTTNPKPVTADEYALDSILECACGHHIESDFVKLTVNEKMDGNALSQLCAAIEKKMKEFAKYHIEQALKAAADNAEIEELDEHFQHSPNVDRDSILNAYKESNIV